MCIRDRVCANFCKAQDVIVMQDGSTVLAKVMKVTKTEVTYKKHNNLQGPDYTANVSDIVSINYENGTKETFNPVVSQTQVQSQADIYTSEVQTSDSELLKKYYGYTNNISKADIEKQIKTKRTVGWIGAATLVTAGAALLALGPSIDSEQPTAYIISGSAAVSLGCVWGYCWNHSANKMKNQMEYMNVSLFKQNILSTKNGKFVAGVDAIRLNNNMNLNSYGVGMSLRYNF